MQPGVASERHGEYRAWLSERLSGPQNFGVSDDLWERTEEKANLVQDAYFAALAIEWGCEWITTDATTRASQASAGPTRWRATDQDPLARCRWEAAPGARGPVVAPPVGLPAELTTQVGQRVMTMSPLVLSTIPTSSCCSLAGTLKSASTWRNTRIISCHSRSVMFRCAWACFMVRPV